MAAVVVALAVMRPQISTYRPIRTAFQRYSRNSMQISRTVRAMSSQFARYPNGVPFTDLLRLIDRGVQDKEWIKVIHRHPDILKAFRQKSIELAKSGKSSDQDCKDQFLLPEFKWSVTASSILVYIAPNAFPYHFEKGVSHLVMWTENNSTSLNQFEDVALQKYPKGHDMIIWVNHMSMRSIPGILHAHLVVQPRSDNANSSSVLAKAIMVA
mmetsp:Transcript_22055/g.32869  ORF Transcript_22055/g.32869 Transcript_22055/m.32869 type:complete len:212 (+) Transcript_22055:14-649(+)